MSGITRSGRAATLLALAMLPVVLFTSLAAHAESPLLRPVKLRSGKMHGHEDVLVMVWNGAIGKGMTEQIRAAFDRHKDDTRTVVFRLDSPGGSVAEGERVIKVLRDIKRTHKLVTSVGAGKRCGSMCVFLYTEGDRRVAAPASIWLFHEVSYMNKEKTKILSLDRQRWLDLVDKYWEPNGVNPEWIAKVKQQAVKTDVWESGSDLLRDGSNLIHHPLSDERRRNVHEQASAN